MRTRINSYQIYTVYGEGEQAILNCIVLPSTVLDTTNGKGIEDIRLIVNETQRVVICSSMKKSGLSTDGVISLTPILDAESSKQVGTVIGINKDVCTLVVTDKLTIEIDKGVDISNLEKAAQESTPFKIEDEIGNVEEVLDIMNGETPMEIELPTDYASYEQVSNVGDNVNLVKGDTEAILAKIGNVAGKNILTELVAIRAAVEEIKSAFVGITKEDMLSVLNEE